jgi:hypothetical protein
LYQGPSGTNNDRAYAVSYNRPIDMNSTANLAQPPDFLFGEEYAAIYWLEHNGYNVSYISGIDAATNAALLLNTKSYMDVGHDEYWSQSQYANEKAAADAGVGLAFLSGNQIYCGIPRLHRVSTPAIRPTERSWNTRTFGAGRNSIRMGRQTAERVCFATLSTDPELQKIHFPGRSSPWTISARSTTFPSPPACRNSASGETPALPAAMVAR